MSLLKMLLELRALLIQAPAYVFYYLLSWVYPTKVLRFKAAGAIHRSVRQLLLRRSGIAMGKSIHVSFGCIFLGISRHPPAVTLDDRCAVGPGVKFITSSYPEHSRLAGLPEMKGMIKHLGPIHVCRDAWVGAGAVILPGITIGAGSVVGAGAVVTRDVEPHTLVVGVPAKCVQELPEI